MKPFTKSLIAVITVAVVYNVATSSSTPATEQAESAEPAAAQSAEINAAQAQAKIQDFALDDLSDKSQFPRLNKSLGKKGIKEAMEGSKAAAYRAAKNPECDSVYTAAPSDNPDRPFKKHHEFFVNCENTKQWRFTADELKDSNGHWYTAENAPAAGISDTERRAAERQALEASAPGDVVSCETALRGQLKHPDSADFHIFTGAASSFNAKNEKFFNIDFEAKNGFGAELTYTGQCIFHRDGTVTTQIFDR